MDVARELQRRGGDRHRPLGDARLAPHAPRRGGGGGESRLELGTDKAELGGEPMRRLHLSQHLRLADDEAVERARHGEEMPQRRRAVMAVERGRGVAAAAARQQRRERGAGARGIAGGGDELDAVAGGDEHHVAEAGPAQLLERSGEIGLDQREAVAQSLRCGLVVGADDEQLDTRPGLAGAGHGGSLGACLGNRTGLRCTRMGRC